MSHAWTASMDKALMEPPGPTQMSVWSRPITFDAWYARISRKIELRNFEQSLLMLLPRELRERIWDFALVDDSPVRFFADLCTWREKEFGEQHQGHGRLVATDTAMLANLGFDVEDDEGENTTENFATDGDGNRYRNMFRPLRRCNRALGLLTVSRAVHRECVAVLYRRSRFVFPDWYGFVGLDCFLLSVGRHNLAHLRRLTVHMPPWHFERAMDHDRAHTVLASARAFGLRTRGIQPRDRLLGAFERAASLLCHLQPGLQQLDLVVSPYSSKYFDEKIAPADTRDAYRSDAAMPVVSRRRNPSFAARAAAEDRCLERLATRAPRLRVRFVALEFTTALRANLSDEDRLAYWAQVRYRCDKWGFEYVKLDCKADWDQLY